MGTLRLKRGTKTALQSSPGYTPAEGELVYTTDSKEVFVGDGATQGGIPVSVSTQNLEDLGNVQALAAQKDQILVYNGANWAATDNPALDIRGNIYGDDSTLLVDAINGKIVGPIETTSIISSGNIVGDVIGDVTGSVTGNLVGDTTGTHYGNTTGFHSGDTKGSVFGDDSGLLVDGVNSLIVGPIVTETTLTIKQDAPAPVNSLLIQARSADGATGPKIRTEGSRGTLGAPLAVIGGTTGDALTDIHGFGWDGTQQTLAGQIKIAVDLDETVSDGIVPGRMLFLPSSTAGNVTLAQVMTWNSKGRLGLGTNRPDNVLHVAGDAKITTNLEVQGTATLANSVNTGYHQFASLTTAQRDALTPANGMVIYNLSTEKFQGRENGAWVNLV
jgi:hypothetical protein